MQKVAAKSTPANNVTTVNTLASVQELIKNMSDYSEFFGYNNLYDINTLYSDISKNVKDKQKNRIYTGNEMTGILNIGAKNGIEKQTQEDSILMLTHPRNEKFKIALVADGMGGQGNGDSASYIAINLTKKWFENLPVEFYNSDVIKQKQADGRIINITFQDAIKNHLIDVNNKIVELTGNKPGTTFSSAIIRNKNGEDIVTSVSIGDSKILKISQDGSVVQLSKDDNIISEQIKSGTLYVEDANPNNVYTSNPQYASLDITYKPRENVQGTHTLNESDIRFHKKNNIITDYLGCGQTRRKIKFKIKSKYK